MGEAPVVLLVKSAVGAGTAAAYQAVEVAGDGTFGNCSYL